jgi:hypothetical protein
MYDKLSDSKITIFYRLPTTEEQIKYTNSYVSRKGRKIESTQGETRIKFGEAIIKGFKEGAFCDAEGKLIASDPESPNYNAAWKTIVKKYAPDIIARLAVHVFEGSIEIDETDEEDPT